MENKKGEGVGLPFLLLLIIGVVVVVLVVMFFTGTLDVFSSKIDALPNNLEAVAQACKIAVSANLYTDYCYNFKKVSDNEYVNCQDSRIQESLTVQGITLLNCPTGNTLVEDAKKSVCESVKNPNQKAKIRFNGGESCPA